MAEEYEPTTARKYQANKRHNKVIEGEDMMYGMHGQSQFRRAHDWTRTADAVPLQPPDYAPSYPSHYHTSGPADTNPGPEILPDTQRTLQPVRTDSWMWRQQDLQAAGTLEDPNTSRVTPPESSLQPSSASNLQQTSRESSAREPPISRAPSNVAPSGRRVPAEPFDDIEEPPRAVVPSSSSRSENGRHRGSRRSSHRSAGGSGSRQGDHAHSSRRHGQEERAVLSTPPSPVPDGPVYEDQEGQWQYGHEGAGPTEDGPVYDDLEGQRQQPPVDPPRAVRESRPHRRRRQSRQQSDDGSCCVLL